MIHTNDKVIKHKVGLLNLAEELGNVSKACKMMGLSRDTFYRYKDAVDEGGVDALLERNRRSPNLKNRIDPAVETVVVEYALEEPAHIWGDYGGTEYCGRADQHDYQLYLALNDIEHTKTKVKSPQTNGICERFHKTILNEFYQVTLRKKIYQSVEELQADLDEWLIKYNTQRTHQGKVCDGRTPMETLIDGKKIWKGKFLN